MEANSLDLSSLDIFLDDYLEYPPNSIEEPTQRKKIMRISEPRDLPFLYDLNKTKLPLVVHFLDGTEKTILCPFDRYFRLINYVWNHPGFAKDADVITMEEKMKDAAPYNVFFNSLKHCPETHEQLYSLSFTDLLCPSLGKLKASFHITFMADIKWILTQFSLRNVHKLPMTIIHGYTKYAWPEKETMEQLYPNIDYHLINFKKKELDLGFHHFHHSKLSIFLYEDDSLRVVIGSANLCAADWEEYNEQIWVSPPCPKQPEGSSVMAGESRTGFKFSLLDYLFTYGEYNIPSVQEWIERIKNADFSGVQVALIFSTPGLHYARKNGCIPHFLGHLLSRDCTIPAPKEEHDSWRIIAQTASLGLIGSHPEESLTTFFLKSLGSHKDKVYFPTLPAATKTKFNLIFPTVQNACNSYLGPMGAWCCYYQQPVKDAQPWLLKYTCQWKADGTKRSRAMPHSKSYCRVSPCWQKMAYFFLSSTNLSRSGWGKIPDQDSGIYLRSYEIGVLFLPKYFGEDYFEIKDSPNRQNKRLFPIIFDLPLVPYGPNDDSFCFDELVEQGIIEPLTIFSNQDESNESENSNLTESVAKLSITEENKSSDPRQVIDYSAQPSSIISKNKWDEQAAEGNQVTEPKKQDKKFNVRPNTDMFFPSFNKKY